MRPMKTIRLGIRGSDRLFPEGIPSTSNILLFGSPGSGKTIFAIEALYRGIEKFNETGVYVSFEESAQSIHDQASAVGWNLKKYIRQSKLIVLNFKIDEIDRNLINMIVKEVRRIKASRLVIDTLSMLSLSPAFSGDNNFTVLDGEKVKLAYNSAQFIYNLIHILDRLRTVTFYLTFCKPDSISTFDGVSEYVCDGILHLRTRSMGKAFLRSIEALKMRKVNAVGGIHAFKITGSGIEVE